MDKKTEETGKKNLLRFDWAIKRLLRNKNDFSVVEGFLSELLMEDVSIVNIGESEGNRNSYDDKFNRVDIMVENDKKEIFLIELQSSSEADYIMRMLYSVSRAIIDHIKIGEPYKNIRKVYSINIVYFGFGEGKDYIYHGYNEFRGIHYNDVLELTVGQREYLGKNTIKSLHPEYYVIKVNGFDDVTRNTLDEWVYYLKHDAILDKFRAKGLEQAKEQLQYDNLSEEERRAYNHYLEQLLLEKNAMATSKLEGRIEGREEGEAERKKLEQELEKERAEREQERVRHEQERERTVLNMFQAGLPLSQISAIIGLSEEEIQTIIN